MHEYSVSVDTAGADDAGDGTRFTLHAEAGRVAAQLLLRRRVGLHAPRHWYHLGRSVHAAAELGVFAHHATLLLGSDLTGATELHGLRLDDAGDGAALPLLLQAALVWLARQADGDAGHDPHVFCELPGWRDAQGQSPFWQGLGQHFAPFTPQQAERRHGPHWQRDLAPLLPRHPMLVSLLADSAQRALSVPANGAAELAAALTALGLHAGDHVGVFDGGPVHEGRLVALAGARGAGRRRVRLGAGGPTARTGWVLAADGERLVTAPLMAGGEPLLAAATADALGLADGGTAWCGEVIAPGGA